MQTPNHAIEIQYFAGHGKPGCVEHRYLVVGFDDSLPTNMLSEAIPFIVEQVSKMENSLREDSPIHSDDPVPFDPSVLNQVSIVNPNNTGEQRCLS